jgi:UDP-N-acetylmuramoylalanine--D-glutamate ligase
MGGRDKGGDFRSLAAAVRDSVKLLVVIGEARELIAESLSESTTVIRANNLESAVAKAGANAKTGDTVLLSPGCASFDQFVDFEDRGNQFKILVKGMSR